LPIADRVQPVAALRPERVVDLDVPARLETDRVQPEVAGRRPAADRDEQLVTHDLIAGIEPNHDAVVVSCDLDRLHTDTNLDTALDQCRLYLLGRERLLPPE